MTIQDDLNYIMPFGRYKGVALQDIPLSYIKWLAETINETSPKGKEVCLTADRVYQYLKK